MISSHRISSLLQNNPPGHCVHCGDPSCTALYNAVPIVPTGQFSLVPPSQYEPTGHIPLYGVARSVP